MVDRRWTGRIRAAVLLALVCLCANAMDAQPMVGTFTCANGNPGGLFDYGDIGDFFDDLEEHGVGGHVVLEVHDTGGPFTSTPNYHLGHDPLSTFWYKPVAGLSAASTLTIRAVAGQSPAIVGAGLYWQVQWSSIAFTDTPFTTVEGLRINAQGGDNCIHVHGYTSQTKYSHFRVSRCRLHGAYGAAINFGASQSRSHNVVVDNNLIWGCRAMNPTSGNGVLVATSPGVEWHIYNNTILYRPDWSVVTLWDRYVFHMDGSPLFFGVVEYNIVYIDATASPGPETRAVFWKRNSGAASYLPASCDNNIIHALGPVILAGPTAGNPPLETWAQWQAAGFDTNSLTVDPRLVNTTPGFEDLHLLPDSPAIDRGVAGPNSGLDVDGDQRPSGSGIDWGADELMQPEIAVEYNATMLTHLGMVDVGLVPANGGTRQFVIHNVERGPLYLGSPPLTLTPGANCAAGTSVLTLPPGTVAPNSSEPFTIRIVPAAAGAFDLTIDIDSSDRATPRFTFTVTGTGVAPNLPAIVAPAAGSSFTGPAGGPLRVFVNPGAALANAQIAITDPEGDLITIHSLVPVSVPPTGVTAPAVPAPAQSHLLDWGGVVAATSAPGDHTWRLEVSDAVNGARIVVSVIVHVVNLPPAHAPVAGQTGAGTPGAPYFGEFTQGEDLGVWADLALLTDPNLGQLVDIAAVQQGVAPTSGAFTFAAQAGTLRVRPSGLLAAQDRGTHRYTVQVTDGAHVVAAEVELFVWGATGAIQFMQSSLPPGEPGKAYTHQIAVTGATGGVVYSVVNGALPAWLSLDTATGALSGTPNAAGQWAFTIRVIDNTQDTATQPFELTVATPPPPAGNTTSGSAGCVARVAAWPWILALALWRRRRV